MLARSYAIQFQPPGSQLLSFIHPAIFLQTVDITEGWD